MLPGRVMHNAADPVNVERRQHRRVNVGTMVVSIDPRDGRDSIQCCVWDLSVSGACLMAPPDTEIPKMFGILIDGVPHDAHVVWRTWTHVGVRFSEIASAT